MGGAVRLLFVGAPFGRFFRHLAPHLEARGVTVWRTVTEGGEWFGTRRKNRLVYTPAQGDWVEFLRTAIRTKHITSLVTFNDSCRRARDAIEVAHELGIPHYVIEYGYLRPWWFTFDKDGVNGNSILPRDPAFYVAQRSVEPKFEAFSHSFRYLVRDTILHYAANMALAPFLPFDFEYYGDSALLQARGYAAEYVWRKTHNEAAVLKRLRQFRKRDQRPVFVTLMQKPGDAQLTLHSEFRANGPYLRTVLGSFATHAPADAVLIVKQHPLDYGGLACALRRARRKTRPRGSRILRSHVADREGAGDRYGARHG
jgi:capsular polysaccharide export protein